MIEEVLIFATGMGVIVVIGLVDDLVAVETFDHGVAYLQIVGVLGDRLFGG